MNNGSERPQALLSGRPHPVAAAIEEALQAFATRPVSDRILRRALSSAGVSEVPRGGARLRRFVAHDLRAATAVTLDDDTATAVTASLAPLLARFPAFTPVAGTPVLESAPGPDTMPAPTSPPPGVPYEAESSSVRRVPDERLKHATPRSTRDVLVATGDGERLSRLARALPEQATTLFVEDVVALLELLQHPRQAAPVIVLDCQRRAIHPTTLATVASELPPGAPIVLWGLDAREWDALSALLEDSSRWHHLAADADASAAAERIAAL
ncbi:MAG: hypothetical protein AAF447_22835 [Myxococcota bacterium]